MYEVVVEAPQSPGDFFSNDFTEARLQQQVSQGRIGPDNLPVYVSNIVYGRMMMFSITSTASESDIRATMQAGYSSIGGSVEANLSLKQQSILKESKIKITSIGGDAEATLVMIRSGDWSQYFTNTAPLSSAAPMSYTFRNLGDGSIASVTETTEYNIRSCSATQASPGTFNFLNAQNLGLPIPAPVKVMMGDVNGNGIQDLIYNHVSANSNQTVVAFSNGNGTFTMGTPTSHSVTPGHGWSQYVLKVGDFNNDGRDDLAWSRTINTNTTYVSLSNGDGTFEEKPMFTKGPASVGWGTQYQFEVGNIDGKNGDDLIWNVLSGSHNRTYVTFSNGDGRKDLLINRMDAVNQSIIGLGRDSAPFDFTRISQDHPAGDQWTQFQILTGDLNGDSREDVIYVNADATNTVYVGLSRGSDQ